MKTSIRAAIPLARCAAGTTAGAAPSQYAADAFAYRGEELEVSSYEVIASGNDCTQMGQEIPEHASL